MKTARKPKVGSRLDESKARGKARISAEKSNGKRTEQKRRQVSSRAKTGGGRMSRAADALKSKGKGPVESRLLATYERAPVGLVECSLEGQYINVNKEFCRISGYEKRQLLSLSIKDLLHKEDYAAELEMYRQLIAGDIPFYKTDKRYVRRDGGTIWVEITRSLVRNAEGKPLYTIGVVLDIGDRKRVEKKLRQSEEQLLQSEAILRGFYESAPTMMGVTELAGDDDILHIYDNPATCRFFGVEKDGTSGRLSSELGAPRRAIEEWIRHYHESERLAAPVHFEYLHRDGKRDRWLSVTVAVISPGVSQRTRFCYVAEDVTESKLAEAELRESRQRLLATYEHAPIGLVECSPEGRYINVNEEFCRLSGYEKDELLGRGLQDLSHEEDYSLDVILHQQLVEGRIPSYQIEKRYTRKDGRIVWTELTRNVVRDADGQALYTIGAIVDVTERKEAEREIQNLSRLPAENPNPVMRVTPEGRILHANNASAPLLEFWNCRIGQNIPDQWQKQVADAFVSGEKRDIEIAYDNKVLICTLAPINEAGYVNLYGSDITERKRVERELARERELLERLFEAIPVMLTVYEPSTKLLRLNSQFERLTGWNSEEAEGISLMEACYPDPGYRQQVQRFMESCAEDEWMDIRMQTRDGRTLETSWANIRLSNDMQVGIGIDITERKLFEEALAEFARQEQALFTLADRLHRTSSLGDVFDAALDAILNALECDRASILLSDDAGVMRFVAWRGLTDGYRSAAEGHSPWKPDVRNPQPVYMNDVGTAEVSESLRAAIQAEGIGSLAFIPLVSNEKLIGKFMVYFNTPHAFSQGELDLSLIIARQLAFGIERQRAEERLRESEERFRAIVSQATAGIIRKDLEGRLLFVNQAFADLLGYSESELIGRTMWELTHEEDIGENKRLYGRLLEEGNPFELEKRLIRRDGSIVWVNVSVSPVMDAAGRPESVVSIYVDITGRKLAEEKLRRAEERERVRAAHLEAIMEAVPAVIWIAQDRECRVISGNRLSHEILRLPPDANASLSAPQDVRPTNFEVLYEGRVLRPEELPVQRAARGEEVRNFEEEVRFEDGTSIYLLGNATPLYDAENNLAGAVAAFVDITERKRAEEALRDLNLQLETRVQNRTATIQAINQSLRDEIAERRKVEEALRESETTARMILDTSPDAIVITDEAGRIVRVNAQIESLFGYQQGEVLGKPVEMLIPERFHQQHLQHRLAYGHKPYRRSMGLGMELFGRRKDDSEFPVDVMLTPISSINGWDVMITVRDSTERKRMEAALRESHARLQVLSRRLVEVQEEERRLLARELHDRVGQTLAALNINLIIMSGQLPEEALQRIGSRMDDSIKLVSEAITLVRNVMTDLRPAVLDDYGLEAALQSYIDDYRYRYGIRVNFDHTDQPLPRQDPSREMTVLRIAQEALTNVARHARADQVRVSLHLDDRGAIHLTVEDNGVGVESPGRTKHPGSHGMKIMRERAEAFGGTVEVESWPGKGTRVEAMIPLENGGQGGVSEAN